MPQDALLEKAMRRAEARVHASGGSNVPILFSLRTAAGGYQYRPFPLSPGFWEKLGHLPASEPLTALAAHMSEPGAVYGGIPYASTVPPDLVGWAFLSEATAYPVEDGVFGGESIGDVRFLCTVTVNNQVATLTRFEKTNEVTLVWSAWADSRSAAMSLTGQDERVPAALHQMCQFALRAQAGQ